MNEKILSDMKQVTGECNRARSQLRHERLNLMKKTASEAGIEVDIDDDVIAGKIFPSSLS